jgi:hypothetical protein
MVVTDQATSTSLFTPAARHNGSTIAVAEISTPTPLSLLTY